MTILSSDTQTRIIVSLTSDSAGEELIHAVEGLSFPPTVPTTNSGANAIVDYSKANNLNLILTNNSTVVFSNPLAGNVYILKLIQDATGSRTVTWPLNVKWNGGTVPTLSTAPGSIDIASFYYDGVDYFGTIGLGYA